MPMFACDEILPDESACCPTAHACGETMDALYRAFHLLQEKWVLFIVHSLSDGPLGFNELGRRATGVNTTTLSQRLTLLEQQGIVTRTVCSTIPPKTSYSLTESGSALLDVIAAIERWSEQHHAVVGQQPEIASIATR